MQNYNNPDTNVFLWRKRIRQMRWSEFRDDDPDRFVQIKPWLLIAHARACFYFNVVVNKQIIQSFTCIFKILFEWSGRSTAGFCLEPWGWVTEQKGEARCGFFNSDCKMASLLWRNPSQASLTRDILLREVKLFGFMKKRFNFAMSKPTVLFIFYI